MTQPLRQPPPTAATISTVAEARGLGDALMQSIDRLLAVVERETQLVRAGKIADAIRLESDKTDLSRRYVAAIALFKANQPYFVKAAPDLLAALQRHHDVFRAMLQVNLTVLATAHAVSEGIVRGVNAEIQRRNSPQTYTAYGRRMAPARNNATPIAVSRSL